MQVKCFVAVNKPESTSSWMENGNAQIRVKSTTTNCILPSEIKLAWKHVTLDNQSETLSATSVVLMLTNLSKTTRADIITKF